MNFSHIYEIFKASGVNGVLTALSLEGIKRDEVEVIRTLPLGESQRLGVSKDQAEVNVAEGIDIQISNLSRK